MDTADIKEWKDRGMVKLAWYPLFRYKVVLVCNWCGFCNVCIRLVLDLRFTHHRRL